MQCLLFWLWLTFATLEILWLNCNSSFFVFKSEARTTVRHSHVADTDSIISLQKDLQQRRFFERLLCRMPEVHLELCQISMTEFFVKVLQQNALLVFNRVLTPLNWLMCLYKGVILCSTRNLIVAFGLDNHRNAEQSWWDLSLRKNNEGHPPSFVPPVTHLQLGDQGF